MNGISKLIVVFVVLCGLSYAVLIGTRKEVGNEDVFSRGAIFSIMKKVFKWQINHFKTPERYSRRWQFATFYAGAMAAYNVTENDEFLKETLRWAEENRWETGLDPRRPKWRPIDPRPADNQCCGQVYLELYLIKKDPRMLADVQSAFDKLVNRPPKGRTEWWWCDALFMAAPVLARLGKATNETKYYRLLHEMWWDTTKFLFDEDENLFYRDKKAFQERARNGKKVFWARGNGWVMAGIARILDYLPEEDPKRTEYVKLLQRMAGSVIKVQGEDGLWRTSLLDYREFPQPETSSSALFCFALAWGINHGVLDSAIFLPAARKAWKGLYKSVDRNGKLCWVQKINRKPVSVAKGNTASYGAGAFLLAASEMIKLNTE